jgi:tetratricopeptide (TPR) repeat protein
VHRANLLLVAALLMRTPELYESALAAFDDAIRLSPNQVHHRYRLAEALTLTGRIDEAMAQLDSAAAIAPAFGATDYFRARFSLLRGDLDGATTAARAAIAKGYVSDARLGLRLDDALAGAGRPLHLRIALLRAFLLERRGTVGLHAARPGRAASDRPLIERLALLQSEAGDDESARRLRALVSADSAAAAAR